MRTVARNQAGRRVVLELGALSWAWVVLSSTAAAASLDANAAAVNRTLTPEQLEAAVNILASHMDVLRDYGPRDVVPGLPRFAGDDDMRLSSLVNEYTEDSNPRVVRCAHGLMFRILQNTSAPVDRQTIVGRLVEDVADPNNAGDRGHILERLADLARTSDFTDHSKEILRELVAVHSWGKLVLVVGVAGIESELPRLQEMIDDLEGELKQQYQPPSRRKRTYWENSVLWAALRARARMGVTEDIQRCIDMVESHPEPSYRVGWLLRELSYVRQPEVVSYISEYLHTDRMLPSRGDDAVAGSYAQGAAQALAWMLEDFPKKPGLSVAQQDIETIRNWMVDQTEWKIIR